jgi:hypothetical protein
MNDEYSQTVIEYAKKEYCLLNCKNMLIKNSFCFSHNKINRKRYIIFITVQNVFKINTSQGFVKLKKRGYGIIH